MNAPKPIVFFTTEEAELRFSLSNRKLIEMQRSATSGGLGFLWLACDNKGEVGNWQGTGETVELTEDLFIELMPMSDPDLILGLVQAITEEWKGRARANPKNEHLRPTKAETQPSNGSGSLPSGELTLVA
jgi:hypothetical protein